jgi:hypothetical protein
MTRCNEVAVAASWFNGYRLCAAHLAEYRNNIPPTGDVMVPITPVPVTIGWAEVYGTPERVLPSPCDSPIQPCPDCDGNGVVLKDGSRSVSQEKQCDTCEGTGEI